MKARSTGMVHSRDKFKCLCPALLLCAVHVAFAQQPTAEADTDKVPDRPPDKSYLWPALEIIGFDLALSNYNRAFSGTHDYDVSWASIRRNLRGPWVVDNDPFRVNQFAHPYQGSLYHGAGAPRAWVTGSPRR